MYLTSLLHGENIGLSSRICFSFVSVRIKGYVVGMASKTLRKPNSRGKGLNRINFDINLQNFELLIAQGLPIRLFELLRYFYLCRLVAP